MKLKWYQIATLYKRTHSRVDWIRQENDKPKRYFSYKVAQRSLRQYTEQLKALKRTHLYVAIYKIQATKI